MGGNIWKTPPTVRLARSEYEALTAKILATLGGKFGDKFFLLPSYRSKEDFGDADILVKHDGFASFEPFVNFVKDEFRLSNADVSRNGHFISVRIENFQVDFIFHQPENWETAKNYYRYSDLGNFIGKVARKLGFKFGHEGLVFIFRDGTHKFDEVVVSKDMEKILEFLGYDPKPFFDGFDTMEDIFKYAASTPYFNKKIYSLDRVRDED